MILYPSLKWKFSSLTDYQWYLYEIMYKCSLQVIGHVLCIVEKRACCLTIWSPQLQVTTLLYQKCRNLTTRNHKLLLQRWTSTQTQKMRTVLYCDRTLEYRGHSCEHIFQKATDCKMHIYIYIYIYAKYRCTCMCKV